MIRMYKYEPYAHISTYLSSISYSPLILFVTDYFFTAIIAITYNDFKTSHDHNCSGLTVGRRA